jgi:hypothetical protein
MSVGSILPESELAMEVMYRHPMPIVRNGEAAMTERHDANRRARASADSKRTADLAKEREAPKADAEVPEPDVGEAEAAAPLRLVRAI